MNETQQFDFDDVKTNFAECAEPGVHRDVDFATYQGWKAVNSGVISCGTISMRHFQAALAGELSNDDTKSRKFGRAVHTRLLEPEQYKQRVLVADPCCAILKSGDRKGETCCKAASRVILGEIPMWFCGTHAPAESIEPDDFVSAEEAERIEALAKNLHEHKAMSLLKTDGWSEVSLVFDVNGVRMKGRIDRFSESAKFVLDLKKTRVGHGTREECQKAIGNYNYLRQAAIYVKGIELLFGFTPRFVWVFIEEAPPYEVNIIEPEQWELEFAWNQVAAVLANYALSKERNRFDGYVRFDDQGTIVSSHLGALPAYMARVIREGTE